MKIVYPNYKESIMNVSNSILNNYKVKIDYPSLKELDIELKKGYKHIIYILLDGMGSNLIKTHLSKDDALYKYMNREITSVFPPTTVAATDAVLSGVPPLVNGHIGWVQYFEKEDLNYVVFQQRDFYDDENIIEEDLREKYLSFDRLGERINKVNKDVITNELFPSFRKNGSVDFKEEIEKALIINHNTDQSFTYMYWVEPDLIQHKYGINSPETKKVMKDLNKDFSSLIENVNDDTIVICIADHGLTDIDEIDLFEHKDLMSKLKRLPSIEPRAINFFVKEDSLIEFKDLFNKKFGEYYKLYTTKEVLDLKLFGEGKKHILIDSFLGDYIGIATSKYMFKVNSIKVYKAHHAGLLEDEMMVPLIIYSK